MNNPFIKCIDNNKELMYLDSVCSINKVLIAQLPIKGIESEIEGKLAGEVFSTKVINQYIYDNAARFKLDIDNEDINQLTKYISRCLNNNNIDEKKSAELIVKKFGYRLGIILLTLKTGFKKNREARPDWNEEHWNYWNQLDDIILVGGLSNDSFGEYLRKYAIEIFELAGVKPYNILLFNNASHLGIMGCATKIKASDGAHIVFDFGQTNIKRSLVIKEHNKIVHEKCMPSIVSKHMQIKFDDLLEKEKESEMLNDYIINNIVDTYKETSVNYDIGSEVIVGIANYTINGRLNSIRGGYSKLSNIAPNYAMYLSKRLSEKIGKKIHVTLVHDGTAIALHFKEYTNGVCMSIGTAFGVGFPF